ncbi:ribosomal-protein-alanine acetyltransferase [Azospirillum agricola]|uniref:ribosomal protein S18-alanine N-acetyltransferase n=1 Tax=Azospirillum agricola TaxID=1720247 RepID=UPI001AE2E65E|nr:ribosomal protein S18-alanine N-acetyltransferase [Azospirillum agricola]MBP2227476.1 ribosomal-protein-alanine acetyltransferase [Azospirillum agricola]
MRDIPALLAIEDLCFPTDRMSRRNFRYAITHAKGAFLVAERAGRVAGYGVVGFHAGTRIGRLTSFAVDPGCRRLGIARRLLAALEDAARGHGCRAIRLEVRRDNTPAIALYTRTGYGVFGLYLQYYEDDMAALRLEKRLEA